MDQGFVTNTEQAGTQRSGRRSLAKNQIQCLKPIVPTLREKENEIENVKGPINKKKSVEKTKSTPATSTCLSNDYGSNAQQVEMEPGKLQELCEENAERMKLSAEEISKIEQQTRTQADCSLWHEMRKQRLTASRFGEISKRRKSTPCARLVKELLYPKSISSDSLRWGKDHEKVAIEEYCKATENVVHPAGLFICKEHGYLAASPDGVIVINGFAKGLTEVKCPYSAIRKQQTAYSPFEAAQKIKNFPLEVNSNGKLSLKKNHHHMYQVQGQLHITGYKWCDYVVWTPSGLHIERIQYSETFWEKKMFPNLKWFYFNCLLPEVASPRHPQGLPVREPTTVSAASSKRKPASEA